MPTTLLEQFLSEECTPEVRMLVSADLRAGSSGSGPRRKRFEFNRFEVTFDLDAGDVLIEDVLDVTDAGVQRIAIGDFVAALGSSS